MRSKAVIRSALLCASDRHARLLDVQLLVYLCRSFGKGAAAKGAVFTIELPAGPMIIHGGGGWRRLS